MGRLNELLQELGVSKVRLAKYLGVSRQMIYNYLELKNINKWPKEKKILLFKLLDIENGDDAVLNKIKVNTDFLMAVEQRLNQAIKEPNSYSDLIDLKGLNKDEQRLISDIISLTKEKFSDDNDKNRKQTYYTFLYIYHFLQSLDNVTELKYILSYVSKTTGFTNPKDFKFNEDKQLLFEGIIHSALTLYHSGGASRSKILESHNRFVQEIDAKNEEKLSRTQQLNTFKVQALRELGYDVINTDNAAEVLEKIAEIQSRKV